MKTVIVIAMTLGLTAALGCSMSSRGGGMSQDEGFRIAVPGMDTEVKQGELQTVTVSLHRGESFKRDVKLQMRVSKGGISVDPAQVLVKASDKPDVQLQSRQATTPPSGSTMSM